MLLVGEEETQLGRENVGRFAQSQAERRALLRGKVRDRADPRHGSDAVEVLVRDNGIGIPMEIRDKLFQPFFTTKRTGEGTGLGLSISYDIVTQQHAGTIKVASEVGAFTEFTVRLPRRLPRGAAAASAGGSMAS